MATSGTATFNLDLADVIDEAYERCGEEGARTGYALRTARRSLGLLFADWASRGLNMFTFEQGSIPLVAGTGTYDLPVDTVDLLEHVIRTGSGSTQADLVVSRISVSTYATIPTKTNTGRPIQIYVERLSTPRVTLWPVPDASTPYTLVYWRLRRIQDPGTGATNQDVPYRFLPVLVSGLAYYLAMKTPNGLERLQVLKQQYDEAWDVASSEDREKAPVRWVPRIGPI